MGRAIDLFTTSETKILFSNWGIGDHLVPLVCRSLVTASQQVDWSADQRIFD